MMMMMMMSPRVCLNYMPLIPVSSNPANEGMADGCGEVSNTAALDQFLMFVLAILEFQQAICIVYLTSLNANHMVTSLSSSSSCGPSPL
jgi:hypothetical protein